MKLSFAKKGEHDQQGIWLFTLVKNEEYFLPFFFEHYKKLGVSNFVIYDDKSTDNTRDILESESSCSIIQSEYTFGQKVKAGNVLMPFNDVLKNSIHSAFFPNSWGIYVDCDEFMVLPENIDTLHELVYKLEAEKQYQVFAPMVDFYPEKLALRNYNRTLSPFEGCSYFDRGPVFRWLEDDKRALTISGIRLRLKVLMKESHPVEFSKINGGTIFNGSSVKIPLIKHGNGILRQGAHYTNTVPSFDNQVALAHFKFYPDFDAKLKEALMKREYYGGSIEYQFLNFILEKHEHGSLLCEDSVKFNDATDFSKGLIW